MAFVRFNTRLGKAKPVTLRALLDSGGSETIVSTKYVKNLRMKTYQQETTVWTTPGGEMTTNRKVKSQFTIPELHDDRLIEWNMHVTDDLGAYDIIIGRDILNFLGIDIKFSNGTCEWDGRVLPFKHYKATVHDSYHLEDPEAVEQETDRLKKILDAKYVPADLEKICSTQSHLKVQEQQQLLELLSKYAELFDGTLGTWKGQQVDLELKEGATPYHARAYPIPRCHIDTLKMEVERLCQAGVLKKVNRSEWAAPTFIIPKKDKTVRFISDFRELNKRIKRKPFPIPHIQDMLMNLEGFQYATSLDLNMGYYHIELSPYSRELCTIVLPFGKYEYQRLPMGLCNSPDIFQEKMSELMQGLEFVRTYIDDLLCLTKGTFEDHLEKIELVFKRLQAAGLRVNATKSFFARPELEYLGYWITRDGIQPVKEKVAAIMKLDEPKTRKELRSFIGIVNYYRDMWIRRSHILAPLAALTSKTTKWHWGEPQRKAFLLAKKVIAREVMLTYPDFNAPFEIHTDASHYQLGAVISQRGKPIAFYSRKLNPAQTRYTTTERELLSIVETLKEYRNILLGQQIEVFTDHKNLVYKHFNTERVMRWRLLIEEFGPKLTYIKGPNNIVADALSRMRLTEAEFSLDAFSGDTETADFPTDFPLSYKQLAHEQSKDNKLQELFTKPGQTLYKKTTFRHSDQRYELITKKDKIVIPKNMQLKAVQWYHLHLLHPGETRLELTMRQHFDFIGLKPMVVRACKACQICRSTKARNSKYGLLPPKEPELIPWHTLCIDLIGPYKFGADGSKHAITLHALTMIDPATGWFEIAEIPTKRADDVANILEEVWLTRYPWPTEIVLDRGKEFCAEVSAMLKNDYGITKKLITTRNPQANAIVERIHQVVHNMIRTRAIKDSRDLPADDPWTGILSCVRQAMRSLVHTTTRATPTQLVFGRDAMFNVSFEADWQYIKERKQRLILQNNKRENATRKPHTYHPGDRVMIKQSPSRKHGEDRFDGPYTVIQQNDNGTVKLSKAAPGGAVYSTWNVRQLDPCLA
jgi:transposase InsO family protein